ncbi:hypothetical protein G7085_18115 [Tessaracoccus sp. HDW20]|uniref:hypothetical protein n=1 Tax=Tessaracoccus coleopterorum TaxID=2714950 RepID=UPI0018D314EB|nr:hypothetical protein [Tessaracoccus coleopterorum]NHB85833.1 hypothetical protein [Tessaracoccus coleopterorum]
MGIVRSLAALLLLTAAGAFALLGSTAHWADNMARTPGHVEEVVAPLIDDPVVLDALAGELDRTIRERIPASADRVPGLRARIEQALTRAVGQVMEGEGVSEAWEETIGLTRDGLVAELDAYREDPSETPTIWLDLTPFADLGRERIGSLTDTRLWTFAPGSLVEGDVRVALGRIDAGVATMASEALGLARHWVWGYVAAAVLAALGLVIGTRSGRWIAWLIAAVAGLAATFAARIALGSVDVASGDSLRAALTGRATASVADSLAAWMSADLRLFGICIAVGAVGLVTTALLSRSRERDPEGA